MTRREEDMLRITAVFIIVAAVLAAVVMVVT
jgi:hypothetical protein